MTDTDTTKITHNSQSALPLAACLTQCKELCLVVRPPPSSGALNSNFKNFIKNCPRLLCPSNEAELLNMHVASPLTSICSTVASGEFPKLLLIRIFIWGSRDLLIISLKVGVTIIIRLHFISLLVDMDYLVHRVTCMFWSHSFTIFIWVTLK